MNEESYTTGTARHPALCRWWTSRLFRTSQKKGKTNQ